ncbi:alpha-amylase family glycosyl hydrolase [Anaeromassilibacillus senegalensis]|uniref:alpha-amylase family glycosyl hydrolase n=1 Tax=Anaeromassilibacillus senegalensis TaxID=1673717 RepID=UPI0006833EA8|nr:alpha-amylase family glycosyl hydrolase [Anaeromassilibacillus senegalensis]
MSKAGKKWIALLLAAIMVTSAGTAGMAARVQNGADVGISASQEAVTVTFDAQGGMAFSPIETTRGSTILLPENPSKPGYAFKGWYTEPDGEGALFYIDTPVEQDMTVYAYWAEIPTGIIDEQPSDTYYEIFVRAFCDSDGDGIGDFNGLASKMDYLQDLGITGIWLMPVTESGSYHGYDTVDYYDVEQDYGTMEDFENMLDAAHEHGIRVIMDLVVNHSSRNNPWFVDAITNPETSPYRDYYKIEKSTDYDEDKDNNATDDAHSGNKRLWQKSNLAPGYRYLGLFGGGMPDLNYDNPAVHDEMIRAGQFWLEKGVDGFRLDAARHIYGDYLDTMYTPEIADKNAAWWKDFRTGMEEVNPEVFLVGEVWEQNTDRMVPFVQDGALESTFDFSLASELLETAKNETNGGFVSELCETFDKFGFASNGKFIDCTFLTNHDQNRTMSVMEGNKDHAKVAASLYLTLPGNPFIYYGEEVGLEGMKPDQNIREPMPWYESNKGPGLTDWLEGKNKYSLGGETSVEAQEDDPASILSHYKELLRWRKEIPALGDGDVAAYDFGNESVASYIRMTNNSSVLVATNLTDEAVTVTMKADDTYGSFSKLVKQLQVDTRSKLENGSLTIAPYSTVVLSGDVKPSQYSVTYSKNVELTVDGEAQRLADLIGRFTADVTDEEVKLAFAPAVEGRELAAVSVNGTAMEVKDPDVFTYPVSPNEDRHTMFAFTVVNKQVLRVMIKAAEEAMRKVDEETILPAVKEAMEKALVNAAAVEESLTSTQEEIDEAWSTLLKALHCIDFVKGDKSQLNYRIDVAEQMDLNDYTTLYVEEFRIALIDAKKVAADENAMDDEITEAADRLEQAMLALVHRADISYLEFMISTAKGLDLDAYLDDGKAELAEVLAAAEQLADDRDAVQSDVNDAVDALAEALLNLRKAANKDALKGTIRTAESIDLSGYTAKSVARLQEALGNAKAAEGDNTLGEEDQPFVDARTEELQEAIDGLEKENKTHNSSGGGSGKKSRPSADAVAAVTAPVAPEMKAPSVVSDTTLPFAIKRGSAYCFKMTVKDGGTAVLSFTVGNGAVLKTQFVTRIGNDFYFRVWAVGAPGQQTGVYTTLPGQAPQLQCVVTIS